MTAQEAVHTLQKVRDLLSAKLEGVTPGIWGRYGNANPISGVIEPHEAAMEAAPGLCIGSTSNTEPVARFSGYLMPVEKNVDFVAMSRIAVPTMLRSIDAVLRDWKHWTETRTIRNGEDISAWERQSGQTMLIALAAELSVLLPQETHPASAKSN